MISAQEVAYVRDTLRSVEGCNIEIWTGTSFVRLNLEEFCEKINDEGLFLIKVASIDGLNAA